MYGVLNLTWKPSADSETPPAGQAPAIVRGDTYAHTIRVTDGWLEGLQAATYAAQLRTSRLTSSTAAAATASFSVVETQDGDDLLLTLGLTSVQTLDLPAALFWDLQSTNGSTIATLLAGKVKVLDDVTRVA